MKRKFGILLLVGALMLTAAPVWADDFYVIGGGGGVGTKISSVPITISNSGFYYLGGNLTCASGTAITVSADNVTLDLMGFTLTGNTTSYGIYLGSSRNVEIRNGTIQGCYAGIYGSGGNCRVISVKASSSAALAMQLNGAGSLFQNCSAFNTGPVVAYGSCMYLAEGTITGCTSNNNNIGGIGMAGPGMVTNSTATHNGTTGFFLNSNIYVNGNVALSNTGANYSAGTTGMVWGMNVGSPPHMNNPTPYSTTEPPSSQSAAPPGNNNLNVR